MREQLTFYRSYWEAVKRLRKAADRLSALEAILAYALDDEDRERTDAADAIFVLVKPFLDSAAKKANGGKSPKRVAEDTSKISGSCEEDSDNKKKNKYKNKNKNNMLERVERFTPPTEEEAKTYYDEIGANFGFEAWLSYYQQNGWMVGNRKMKDWKASMRYWKSKEKPLQKPMNQTAQGIPEVDKQKSLENLRKLAAAMGVTE